MIPQDNHETEVNPNQTEDQLEDLEAENLTAEILVENDNNTNTTSNNNETEGVEDIECLKIMVLFLDYNFI